MMHKKRYNT